MDLTISIGTLRGDRVLEGCLRSIYASATGKLKYEVRIVYNGPRPDGAAERIRAVFPLARVDSFDGPLGFCKTHNLVLRERKSRYVLVLDDDTLVREDTLAKMLSFMDLHPDVGLAGCKTLNPDGSLQPSFGLLPNLKTEILGVVRPNSLWPASLYRDTSSVREVEWLNGSFMLARSSTVDDVGLLDERFYTYGCESDWCYRIRKAGWKVMFVPSTSIIHYGGEHSINSNRMVKKHENLVRYHVNRFYFFRKHYGQMYFVLLRYLVFLAAASRLAYYGVLYAVAPQKRDVSRSRFVAFAAAMKLSVSRSPDYMPEPSSSFS